MSDKIKRKIVLRARIGTILLAALFIVLLQMSAGRYTSAGLRAGNSNPRIIGADNITHFATAGCSVPPQGDRQENNRVYPVSQKPNHAKASGGLYGDVPHSPHIYDWLDSLIEKIWRVESSGRTDPPDGDGGKAAGPLQIHKAVVDDVNRYYKMNFTYADRYDINKAKQIAKLYIQLWMERHKEEIATRIFNGGPRGWRKKSTDTYWADIRVLGVK